jgi:hypothetical protein
VSIRHVADVLDHVHGLPHGSKLVLICLADYANKEGLCWPSFQSIADRVDMSRRHVIRVMDDLELLGLIAAVKADPYKPTTYQLFIPTSDTHVTSDARDTSDTHVTTLVTPTSLPSDAHVTSTSDAHVTQSVNRTTIEPSGNRKSSARAKRATPFPDDFQPPYEWAAKELGMSLAVVDAELPRMRDWALSKGETKKDWTAFARNWLRRKHDQTPRGSPSNGVHLTAQQRKHQRLLEIANGEPI